MRFRGIRVSFRAFALFAFGIAVGIDPAFGQLSAFTQYPIPTATAGPNSICSGPDGNGWFTEESVVGEDEIGRITPAGVITLCPQLHRALNYVFALGGGVLF